MCFRIGGFMFTLYKCPSPKKEDTVFLSEEKKRVLKALVKGLKLKIVPTYIGNEHEFIILEREQAEDENREKLIQALEKRLKKLSPEDKHKAIDLKNRTLQIEKALELIRSEIKTLTDHKNKAIALFDEEKDVVNQLASKQEYLKETYATKEKPQLERKFSNLKVLNGQEAVVEEIKGSLKTIISAPDIGYHAVIEQLQKLATDLGATKDRELETLNESEAVKLAKKLTKQKALLQQYKDYLKNKKENPQLLSPAGQRTKLVMEANRFRHQFNTEVAEQVSQKYSEQRYLTEPNVVPHFNEEIRRIKVAAQYCIAKLEQVDTAVQEKLQKKCIDAGWSLDKHNGLFCKDHKGSLFSMSDIHKLSYDAYVEIASQQLKNKEVSSQKRVLPTFEEELKRSKQKLVPYKPLSNFWLFCLDKALVSIKPELVSLMDLKTSLGRGSKRKLQATF